MNILDNIYVINVHNNKDSINNIYQDLYNNGIKAIQWGLNKKFADIFFNNNASQLCKLLCTKQSIKTWLSHYSLWQFIVDNKLETTLILENNTVLSNNFLDKFTKLWSYVPKNWDIILLGCGGSCETESTSKIIAEHLFRRINTPINNYVFRPAFPTGLYAYMITYNGAKKLLDHYAFSKVQFNLELTFTKEIADNLDFNIYTFNPPLVFPTVDNNSQNTLHIHKLFDPITTSLQLSSQSSLQTILNQKILHYRDLNIPITYFTLVIFILAFIFGLSGNTTIKTYFLPILYTINIIEISFTRTTKSKVKSLILESTIATVLFILGDKIGSHIRSKYKY